jgi:RHS repeat-associated protein
VNAVGTVEREVDFVWDGHNVIHELDSERGLVSWQWEPESFTPIAKEHAGRRWTIASDHLGTPTEMYDDLGQLAWKMQLDVYGVPRFEAGTAEDCPWRWPGQYEDGGTGLSYNRWRYYSRTGTFSSPDPLGIEGATATFGYPEDPLVQMDPSGQVALNAPGYSLYHVVDTRTGRVVYVGITNDVDTRRAQHEASGRVSRRYQLEPVEQGLTYAQARGYEQADIDHYRTRRTSRIGEDIRPGEPNRVWSYDPGRTDARARAFRRHERARTRARGGC